MRRAMLSPLLGLMAVAATWASAQEAMTADEFEAYVEGRTLTYAADGPPYGAEEYRPGRRVRWTVFDGTCAEGVWYPRGEDICFRYEGMAEEKCWRFSIASGGLSATFVSDPDDFMLYEVEQSEEPLECPGPEVGV